MKIHGRRGSSLRRPSLCSRKSRGHLQRNRDIRSIFPHPRSSCRKLRPEQGPPHWANISHRRDQRRPGQIVWCRATARIPGQRDVATHPSARAGRAVNSISNSNPPHGCTLLTILLIFNYSKGSILFSGLCSAAKAQSVCSSILRQVFRQFGRSPLFERRKHRSGRLLHNTTSMKKA